MGIIAQRLWWAWAGFALEREKDESVRKDDIPEKKN